jgi:glutaredoxin
MVNFELVLFTMKGCPFCGEFKDILNENKIKFHEMDIDEYQDEYDLFVKATNNDMIPSFMIIEMNKGKNIKASLYAPERDYNQLSEALEIIKGYGF